MTFSDVQPKLNATDALAPFPAYFTPLGRPRTIKVDDVCVTWTGKELKMDKESPEPLIIRKGLKYYFYNKGILVIKIIEDGAQDLFDKFYKIQKPPDPPQGGDSSNQWEPDEPDRWKWKPDD